MIVEKAIGIDLGTTKGASAVLDLTDRVLLFPTHGPNQECTLPSAVAWLPEENRVVVGREALERRGLDPAPILSIKRRMGTSLSVELAGQQKTPAQISALILEELVRQTRAAIKENGQEFETRRAIITVPAHFRAPEQEATAQAGELAGLDVVELLHEPIAAAIHFCWERAREEVRAGRRPAMGREETFLVYDLGGGTFDVSVIKKTPDPKTGDSFQTLGIAGDTLLGGDDFDRLLGNDLFERVSMSGYTFKSLNPGEPQNHERYAKLLALGEQIKVALSDSATVRVDRENVFLDDRGRDVHVKTVYTREDVEGLIGGRVERTLQLCHDALAAGHLDITQIDTILLIGGSSRVPLVERRVREAFCTGTARAKCDRPVLHAPVLCIGAGAALKAATHGRIYRPAPTVPGFIFRGYGASTDTTTSLKVDLEDPKAQGTLAGGSAAIIARAGGMVHGEILGPQRVLFDRIPLLPEQNSFFTLQLRTAAGQDLAGCEFLLRHDPCFVEPLGLNTTANVLPYAVSLEVDDGQGGVKRKELAPKLTPLPNKFTHEFEPPGDAETLLFSIYGDATLIKVVRIPVANNLPKCARRVQLSVEIDAAHRIRCSGTLPGVEGERTFVFEVEGPEVAPPTLEEFHSLEAQAHALLAQYPGSGRVMRALTTNRLCHEIPRAFEQRNITKAIQSMGELREIVDELDPAKRPVQPPIEDLDELVGQCAAILQVLPEESSIDRQEISEDVAKNATAAHEAAERVPPDQPLFSRCFENIWKYHETLVAEYQRFDTTTPEDEAADYIEWANDLYAQAQHLALEAHEQEMVNEARGSIDEAQGLLARGSARRAAEAAVEGGQKLWQVLKRKGAPGQDQKGRLYGLPARRVGAVIATVANMACSNGIADAPSRTTDVPGGVVDRVHFSVTSPPSVVPGSSFEVGIWTHLGTERQEVIERAREAAVSEKLLIKSKGPVQVSRGTTLTVRLKIDGLVIEDPEDTIEWLGEIGNADFVVMAPQDALEGPRQGLATIHVAALQIARIHFFVYVGKSAPGSGCLIPARVERNRKAFLSYASADRDAVLARVQGILKAAPEMDVFMDVLSLRSGQSWERELWMVIPASDVFYLFWSDNARNSRWVEKEWRCALETRGLDFIDPVPLTSPEEVPPPPELASKHFNDWTLAFRRGKN